MNAQDNLFQYEGPLLETPNLFLMVQWAVLQSNLCTEIHGDKYPLSVKCTFEMRNIVVQLYVLCGFMQVIFGTDRQAPGHESKTPRVIKLQHVNNQIPTCH
jgi:hypothetical protein